MNPELIHQYVQGLTLSRMPFGTPLRRVGITNPMVVEMHRWDGSHISFLRKTELASAKALAGKTLGRCRTSVVACCTGVLTTNLPGDGIRSVGDSLGIPCIS
jgi:hypothetical protein